MEIVSRKVPPRCAVTTIIPALGGPSSTTCHSSGVRSAFAVNCHLLLLVGTITSRTQSPVQGVPLAPHAHVVACSPPSDFARPPPSSSIRFPQGLGFRRPSMRALASTCPNGVGYRNSCNGSVL